jgi:hypothetical protein
MMPELEARVLHGLEKGVLGAELATDERVAREHPRCVRGGRHRYLHAFDSCDSAAPMPGLDWVSNVSWVIK